MRTILFFLVINLSVYAQEFNEVSFIYSTDSCCALNVEDLSNKYFFSVEKDGNNYGFDDQDSSTFTIKRNKKLYNNNEDLIAVYKKNKVLFETTSQEVHERCDKDSRTYYVENEELVRIHYEVNDDITYTVKLNFYDDTPIARQVAYLGIAQVLKEINRDKTDYLFNSAIIGSTIALLIALGQ